MFEDTAWQSVIVLGCDMGFGVPSAIPCLTTLLKRYRQ